MDIIVAFCSEVKYQNHRLQIQMQNMEIYAHPDAILIPNQSKLYITPITSSVIHGNLKTDYAYQCQKNKDFDSKQPFATVCTAYTRNIYNCASEQLLFDFTHTNYKEKLVTVITDKRWKELTFNIKQDCIVTGFRSYVEVNLYGDINVSDRHILNEHSWKCVPITYYPLRTPIVLSTNDKLQAQFWFHNDPIKRKFWYEWCIVSPHVLPPIHNMCGFLDKTTYSNQNQ